MTEKQEIANWLNKNPRPFNEGLMLHLAYLSDKAAHKRIERTRDEVLLFQQLRARYYELAEEENTPTEAAPEPTPVTNKEELPQELQDAWFQLKTEQERWHTEMCLIGKGKAELSDSDMEKRAKLALLIYQREEELEQLGTSLNYFKTHGKLPEGFAIMRKQVRNKLPKMQAIEAQLYIKNKLAPNISKLKKKISEAESAIGSATGRVLEKKLTQIKKWSGQLHQLTEQKKKLSYAQQ